MELPGDALRFESFLFLLWRILIDDNHAFGLPIISGVFKTHYVLRLPLPIYCNIVTMLEVGKVTSNWRCARDQINIKLKSIDSFSWIVWKFSFLSPFIECNRIAHILLRNCGNRSVCTQMHATGYRKHVFYHKTVYHAKSQNIIFINIFVEPKWPLNNVLRI